MFQPHSQQAQHYKQAPSCQRHPPVHLALLLPLLLIRLLSPLLALLLGLLLLLPVVKGSATTTSGVVFRETLPSHPHCAFSPHPQHDEIVSFVLVLLQHSPNQPTEHPVLRIMRHVSFASLLDKVVVGCPPGVAVLHPFLSQKAPHRADKEESQTQSVHVQLERVHILVLGLAHQPQKLRRAILQGGDLHIRLVALVDLSHILEVAQDVAVLGHQYVLGLDVAVTKPLLLQHFQQSHQLLNQTRHFFLRKRPQLFLPAQHVTMQVALVLLHEKHHETILLLVPAVLFESLGVGLPPGALEAETGSVDGGQVVASEGVQPAQDGQRCVGVGDLLEDELQLGLAVHDAHHQVLAVTDQLHLFELVAGVKREGPELLAISLQHARPPPIKYNLLHQLQPFPQLNTLGHKNGTNQYSLSGMALPFWAGGPTPFCLNLGWVSISQFCGLDCHIFVNLRSLYYSLSLSRCRGFLNKALYPKLSMRQQRNKVLRFDSDLRKDYLTPFSLMKQKADSNSQGNSPQNHF